MKIVRTIAVISGAIALVLLLGLYKTDRAKERERAVSKVMAATGTRPSGAVVATVNGEPILESELMAALPDDAFDAQLQSAKRTRLKQLVDEALRAQFLQAHNVAVSDRELERGINEFTKMIMTPGCPCCGGGYESLDDFMQANHFTATDIRRIVSNDVGFDLYKDRLLKEKLPDSGLALTAEQRREEMGSYVAGQVNQEYMAARERAQIQYNDELAARHAGGNPRQPGGPRVGTAGFGDQK